MNVATVADLEVVKTGEIVIRDAEAKAGLTLEYAKSLKVMNADDYALAGEALKRVKGVRLRIEEAFKPSVAAAHAAHKAAKALLDRAVAPTLEAEDIINRSMSVWHRAEKDRKEKEAREREAEARKIAEDKRIEDALALQEAGKKKQAEALIARPVLVAKEVAEPVAPKIAGIQARTTWKYEIIDEKKIGRAFLIPDEKTIAALVRQQGERAGAMVGEGALRIWDETKIASGRA